MRDLTLVNADHLSRPECDIDCCADSTSDRESGKSTNYGSRVGPDFVSDFPDQRIGYFESRLVHGETMTTRADSEHCLSSKRYRLAKGYPCSEWVGSS